MDVRKKPLQVLICFLFIYSSAAAGRNQDVFHFNKDGEDDWNSSFDNELYWNDYPDSAAIPHLFPSNGDMRLVSSTSFLDTPMAGRLEVYIEAMYCTAHSRHHGLHANGRSGEDFRGKWGTVCGQGFSMNEAHVACRQLGYQGAQRWNYSIYTEFGIANESTPIVLSDVKCSQSSHLHLLRCSHDEPDNSDTDKNGCNHSNDVVVYCAPVRIWDDPYSGQVRLVSDHLIAHSYGRVEIFQGQWGTVCKQNFNEVAAISICRQLGYTGAVAVSDAQPGTGIVWVNKVSCEMPQPCFTSCFAHHKWTHDCNHTQDIAVQCAFDENRASEMTSGSRAQCEINVFPLTLLAVSITLALLSILVLGCGLIGFIVITRFCRRRLSPKSLQYEQLS